MREYLQTVWFIYKDYRQLENTIRMDASTHRHILVERKQTRGWKFIERLEIHLLGCKGKQKYLPNAKVDNCSRPTSSINIPESTISLIITRRLKPAVVSETFPSSSLRNLQEVFLARKKFSVTHTSPAFTVSIRKTCFYQRSKQWITYTSLGNLWDSGTRGTWGWKSQNCRSLISNWSQNNNNNNMVIIIMIYNRYG